MNDIVFGVFNDGTLVIMLGRAHCNPVQAEMITRLLEPADKVLIDGHYFAWDYAAKVFPIIPAS